MSKTKIKNQKSKIKNREAACGGSRDFGFWSLVLGLARKRAGMTLLLTVLILSALLVVSVGIFNVVFGELKISGEMTDSFIALYAADQGIEHTLYDYFVAGGGEGSALGCPPRPAACNFGPETVTLANGACYVRRLSRTGSDLEVRATGEYNCTTPALSVKRALQYTTQLGSTSGFSPDSTGTLESGLVAYWPMEEPSGTRFDVKGSNDLTDNNTVTSNPGIVGNAAQLTRANQEYLSVADNSDVSTGDISFTWAAWVYFDDPSLGDMRISNKWVGGGPNREYLLQYGVPNTFHFYVSSDGEPSGVDIVTFTGTINPQTWYFIVAWHDSGAPGVNDGKIYIQVNNGAVMEANHVAGGALDTATPLNIGGAGTSENLDGRVDEVGFWKRVLSAQERADLWNGGNGNTCASPCQ